MEVTLSLECNVQDLEDFKMHIPSNTTLKARPLKRGSACLNCRHLKIKCDAKRPICGPCQRIPRENRCTYNNNTRCPTQEWEETTYGLPKEFQGPVRRSYLASESGSPASSEDSFLESQGPPLPMIQTLLQCFLAQASQFGFFLDPDRFYDSALVSIPFGDAHGPSTGLLAVVYLWAVHLSQMNAIGAGFSEPELLRRSRQHVLFDTSSYAPTIDILHTIQAQAEVYANGAATLAVGCGLHKLRSARALNLPLLYDYPMDTIEEGERIRGFWASFRADIDTPWPLEIIDYEDAIRTGDWETTSYAWFDKRLSQFWESFPPLQVFADNTDGAAARGLALARALTAAAILIFHQRTKSEGSTQGTVVAAARAIIHCLLAVDSRGAHPVVGALCALACKVLVAEGHTQRTLREVLGAGFAEEEELAADVRNGFVLMAFYARESALIANQLKYLLEQNESA
ncbi:hypothetical protein K438DRAFT_2013534 [Mycena galopus ATCC 62051]|nr:hypothetical protein K438DRAFT_2013534 [Mycena galopus ATCC 62051]